MKNFIKPLLATRLIALACLGFSLTVQADTMKPQAVDRIDIQQYAGRWYEIAHLPMYFQRNCIGNTTADYTVNSDQTIGVLNSCHTTTGKIIASQGRAYPQNPGMSKLKVSFLPAGLRWLPFTKGDYWVLRVDSEYQVALIGGPSHKYLWVLSKNPDLDEATYQSYLETARQYGYDLKNLIKTPQQ
ncbi:lipocalin family protein [Acinetobacter sp.]|uniref:lipocalin family protein n=1 Tax=Acinetobacter sp. TaxID=472 RepID=UPI003890DD9C